MRTTTLLTLILALPQSAFGAPEEPCAWVTPESSPRLTVSRTARAGSVQLDYRYDRTWASCAKEQGADKYRVEWWLSTSTGFTKHDDDKKRLRGGEGEARERANLGAYGLCKEPRRADQGTRLSRFGGTEQVTYDVWVQARIVAEHAAKPLAHQTQKVVYPCAACSGLSNKGRVYLRQERTGARLEIEFSEAYWQCAHKGATLRGLFYFADDNREIDKALRPHFVLDGLEKKLKRKAGKRVYQVTVPNKKLCKFGKKWMSFEVWGRGELARVGGGGRSEYRLRCD